MPGVAAKSQYWVRCCRLQEWIQDIHEEMDADKETILLCHAGVRSRNVAGFLASQAGPNHLALLQLLEASFHILSANCVLRV